ncbi:hypothetical protein Slin_6491 [Spirosoma linguale DSM 74]|uniref:Uncharacterized protein n=1 Tax=Spirosoma linguale (strain ATCC 33905 / DSM 74 / LMG 10896 / Claus 1) TaxID=504472 RepID=D2QUG6_SPILD|nr:hypothetical protein Slin_6491 [Spirosoma linguale DSM 74]
MQKDQFKRPPANWLSIQDESANGDGRPLPQRPKKNDQTLPANTPLTDEQQQIRRLQRELREAQMERSAEATRYIKKGGQHLLQGRPRGVPWEV